MFGDDARALLGFSGAVLRSFAFLGARGFAVRSVSDLIVVFESETVAVEVTHGRRSYEVEVRIGPLVRDAPAQRFSVYEIALVCHPDQASEMRGGMALDRASVERDVAELADWTERLADRALRNEPGVFEAVGEAQARASDAYLEGLRASRLRAAVDRAWQTHDLAAVRDALRELLTLSTVHPRPSEVARLRYVESHLAADP